MKALILFIALIINVPAFAGALPSYTPTPTGGILSPGSLSDIGQGFRDWAANDAGDVITRDRIRVPVGAANADMYARRMIPFRSVIGLGVRLLPAIGTAALLYDIFHDMRCQFVDGAISCDGGIPAGSPAYYTNHCQSTRYPTAADACRGALAACAGNTHPYLIEVSVDGGQCIIGDDGTPRFQWGLVTKYPGTGSDNCEGKPVGPDGNCASGQSVPMTLDQVADRIAPYIDKSKAPDIARQAVSHGHDLAPLAQLLPATGPASLTQPATQTVTQHPNGTTSISTVTTTNNITYNGDTYNITNTTVKNNPDGTTETTTETQKDQSQCAKSPKSLACIELGDPPADKPEWQTKTVVYQVDSLGLPAACPAPWTGQVHGWSLSMSWQPACDQAPAIRAGVLALAGLTALMLIITTIRQ